MDTLLIPILVLAGFLAGGLFVSYVMRWCALIFTTSAKHGGDFLGPPRRRLVWALPFLALLHPAPYILCVAAIVAFRQFHSSSDSAWIWCLGGFAVSVVVNVLRTALLFVKSRRRRAVASQT